MTTTNWTLYEDNAGGLWGRYDGDALAYPLDGGEPDRSGEPLTAADYEHPECKLIARMDGGALVERVREGGFGAREFFAALADETRCHCGDLTGERCGAEHVGDADAATVEYVREQDRASHAAAGYRSVGAVPPRALLRTRVARACLADALDVAAGWAREAV